MRAYMRHVLRTEQQLVRFLSQWLAALRHNVRFLVSFGHVAAKRALPSLQRTLRQLPWHHVDMHIVSSLVISLQRHLCGVLSRRHLFEFEQ